MHGMQHTFSNRTSMNPNATTPTPSTLTHPTPPAPTPHHHYPQHHHHYPQHHPPIPSPPTPPTHPTTTHSSPPHLDITTPASRYTRVVPLAGIRSERPPPRHDERDTDCMPPPGHVYVYPFQTLYICLYVDVCEFVYVSYMYHICLREELISKTPLYGVLVQWKI